MSTELDWALKAVRNDQTLRPDMTELEKVQARVWPVQREMEAMVVDGKLTEDLYRKGLVMLAYEYAVAGFPEEAMILVLQIPSEYFKTVAPKHMREDVQYYQRASQTYRILTDCGLIPFHFNIIPQATAKA